MKQLLAAMAFTLVSLTPASAGVIDMSTATCGELLSSSDEDAGTFLFWLDGWFAGQADDTTIDEEALEGLITRIIVLCADNPGLSVLNAYDQSIE